MHGHKRTLGATITADSPWFIMPADAKDHARLISLDALEGMEMSYPVISAACKRELQAIRRQLAK